MTRHRILVIGVGPHADMCSAVLESMGCWEIAGHVARDREEACLSGITVVGLDDELPVLRQNFDMAFVGIGDAVIRERMIKEVGSLGFTLASAVAPSAVIAPDVEIRPGSLISPGAVVNTGAKLGIAVIVNSGAVVEHHCVVGDFSHVAPNATLCGNVVIESHCLIGAGSVVLPNIRIGHGATLAAGAAAARDVGSGQVAGLPRRAPS